MTTEQDLTEAEKLARVPGIAYADGAAGRRARIAGSGLEVFEIINAYYTCGCDRRRVAAAFDWLTPQQLDAAFAYYAAFPDEIDARLAIEDALTPEVVRTMFPWPAGYRRAGDR